MRRAFAVSILLLMLTATRPFAHTAAKTLDIYYIDTEGGQATLFVSPTGQSVLVDTGNAGTGPGGIVESTTDGCPSVLVTQHRLGAGRAA
jgi:hypothetical protein